MAMIVPDEGYSRDASFVLNEISKFSLFIWVFISC